MPEIRRLGVLLALTVLPVFFGTPAAASTGKIAGTVIDASSATPVPRANVTVLDSRLGATTDEEGHFFILNLPPGTYTLQATHIGFAPYTLKDVYVSADLTTTVELKPTPASIQIKGVVVPAARPLVDKNATNAVRIVGGEDLVNLPLRGVADVLALQAGVVENEGRFHVRGSRSDEVGYYVEGASVRNPVTGASAVTLISEAVQEIQLQAGGFNAEYGGANGGLVLQELRTGGPEWKIAFLSETDRFTSRYQQRFDTYSYGHSNQVLTVGGPVADDSAIRVFAALQHRARDSRAVFWDGFAFSDLTDSGDRGGRVHWANPVTPDTVSALLIRPGNIDHTGRGAYDFNGTLLFDYSPVQVRLAALYSVDDLELNQAPVRNMLNLERQPEAQRTSGLLHLRATHFFDPSLFYQVDLSLYNQDRSFFDPVFEDNFLLYNDSTAVAELSDAFTSYSSQGTAPRPYDFFGFPFARPGTPTSFGNGSERASFYSVEEDAYHGLAASVTKQTRVHQLKLGFDYQRWTSRRYLVVLNSIRSAIQSTYPNLEAVYQRYYDGDIDQDAIMDELLVAASAAPDGGDLEDFENLIRQNSQADFYGFDEFGRRGEGEGLEAPRHPILAAAYVQDKIEYRDLILNAGLRWDYFDVDSFRFIDPAAPIRLAKETTIHVASMRPTRTFTEFSPRLGLSFPVSDRTVFHVQYGRFAQMPKLRDMFTGGAALALEVGGGNYIPFPTAFDVKPIRTTQYEIGLGHQFAKTASFDLSGFYRDVKGQLQVRRQEVTQNAVDAAAYNYLANGDFATTKGLELVFRLRRIRRLQAQFNYTLSDARGTGSTINSGIAGIENSANLPTVVSPLDFNQTHRGSANLDYRFGAGDGGSVLERMGFNLLLRFTSGHNFTLATGSVGQRGPELGAILSSDDPRARVPLEPINSSTTPWTFSADLRVDKAFPLRGHQAWAFVYVQNLFNRRNVINVYPRTGNAQDDGFLSDPELSGKISEASGGEQYQQLYEQINLINRQHYWFTEGGDLYGEPRQLRFGLKFEL